jgi:hypothetical protein
VIIDLRTQSVFDIVGVLGVWVFGCVGVLCGEAFGCVGFLGVLGVWVFGFLGVLGVWVWFFWVFFSTTKLRRPWYEFFFFFSV